MKKSEAGLGCGWGGRGGWNSTQGHHGLVEKVTLE